MKKRSIAALAVVAALSLTACSGGGSGGGGSASGGEPVVDGTLRFAVKTDPGSLFRPLNPNTAFVYPWAYESPVYFDDQGKPQAWLAESWTETPNSLAFTIRDGATCSDGTKLTAETVANNYRWILDPANKSALLGLAVPTDAQVENDARTVTIRTRAPHSFLLADIGPNPIYCQGALDHPDTAVTATNGSGLYKLTEAVPGDHYTLERRDDYDWGPKGAPTGKTRGVPKQVVISIVENTSTRANLLLSGELNIASVGGSDEDRVAHQSDALTRAMMVTGGFVYSQATGQPTADERVRVALTRALDLDALTKVNTSGKGERATRLAVMPPEICTYDAVTKHLPTHDATEAERMLDAAGWKKGADGVREKDGTPMVLDFAWNTMRPENAATAELIAEQWKKVGVEVKQQGTEYGAFMERLRKPGAASDVEVVWMAPNYSVPSPLANFVSGPVPPLGSNLGAVSDPKFTELVAAASQHSGADACASWERAESRLYTAADYVPFAMQAETLYSRGVHASLGGNFVTGLTLVGR